MEIKKENIVNVYYDNEDIKKMLQTMFPDIEFETTIKKYSIMERIKTFEDAINELGEEHLFVRSYKEWMKTNIHDQDNIDAFLKLRIITAALNENWQPEFIRDEWRWYPQFYLYLERELTDKNDNWKQTYPLIEISNYNTEFTYFVFVYSDYAYSCSIAGVNPHLCYKSEELAKYSGKQFINLWANLHLIRK